MKKILFLTVLSICLNISSLDLGGMKVTSLKGQPFEATIVLKDANALDLESISLRQSLVPFLKNNEMIEINGFNLSLSENESSNRLLNIKSLSAVQNSHYDFVVSINSKVKIEKRFYGFLPKTKNESTHFSVVKEEANDLSSCLDLSDANQRLKCYDQSLSRDGETSLTIKEDINEITDSEYADDLFGKKGDQLRETIERKENLSLPDNVSSKILSIRRYQVDRYVVTLQNNQSWKILEPVKKNLLKKDANITVSKGLFGTFNLVVEDQNRKYKVKRVK
jgi:hypothetical protein